MHDPANELPRISIPRTSVNKLENGTLLRMCPTTLACSARYSLSALSSKAFILRGH
jgi:hypothetical protein